MACFWTGVIFSWCCWGNLQSNDPFIHTSSNRLHLESFRGLAEDDPGEDLTESRVALALFSLEKLTALGLE